MCLGCLGLIIGTQEWLVILSFVLILAFAWNRGRRKPH
jgi:hypothetical protein